MKSLIFCVERGGCAAIASIGLVCTGCVVGNAWQEVSTIIVVGCNAVWVECIHGVIE